MALSLKRTPKFAPRRPRTRVAIDTVLLLPDDRELPIEVMNISPAGFMGETMRELDANMSLGIEIPRYGIVRAKICWSEAGKIGAHFDAPLPVDWADPDAPVPGSED
jgi:hypothetical protein